VDPVDTKTDGVTLSLKLYHAPEFQLDYQQLMTEAPLCATISRFFSQFSIQFFKLTNSRGAATEPSPYD